MADEMNEMNEAVENGNDENGKTEVSDAGYAIIYSETPVAGETEVRTRTVVDKEKLECIHGVRFGETLEEAIKLHGAGNVYDMYVNGARVDAQRVFRNALKKKDVEALKSLSSEWFPGYKIARMAATVDNTKSLFDQLGEEDQNEMLRAELKRRGKTDAQIKQILGG